MRHPAICDTARKVPCAELMYGILAPSRAGKTYRSSFEGSSDLAFKIACKASLIGRAMAACVLTPANARSLTGSISPGSLTVLASKSIHDHSSAAHSLERQPV